MPVLIPEVMREIEWLGVRRGVPADWEIVRHGMLEKISFGNGSQLRVLTVRMVTIGAIKVGR